MHSVAVVFKRLRRFHNAYKHRPWNKMCLQIWPALPTYKRRFHKQEHRSENKFTTPVVFALTDNKNGSELALLISSYLFT